ncbi:putative serine/threonine/tyrosine-protein kinase HT1 [Cocos nucifera]|uniref:Putative serine/threonine/tyrosine-protein kinase HT1 n=1 Tax=Cocos nucifera TaxID=13894 RepID=A0A8K0HY30_COCNU|nr:putative serine/threonine/tyrosine-protein kinase HT1 [Cocos nucifera]
MDSSRLPAIPLPSRADRDSASKIKRSSLSSTAHRDVGLNQKGSIKHSSSVTSSPSSLQRESNSGLNSQRSRLKDSSFSVHPDLDSKSKLKSLSSQSSSSSNQDPKLKTKGSSSPARFQLDSVSRKSGPLSNQNEQKPKQRSLSPLPATILSDAFKEGRTSGKRFSTPPPSRRGSDNSVFGNLFSGAARDHHALKGLSSTKALEKRRNKKGGGRVNAVETTDQWIVDLSQLYLGLRFASGAHSRLYHGIYKDQPVATSGYHPF